MIINNKSGNYNEKNIKRMLGDNTYILKSDDYKYIWSLNHKRNSGIKDSLFPSNYIHKIKRILNSNKNATIVIDIEDNIIPQFTKSKLTIDSILKSLTNDEIEMEQYDNTNL